MTEFSIVIKECNRILQSHIHTYKTDVCYYVFTHVGNIFQQEKLAANGREKCTFAQRSLLRIQK